MLLLDMYAIEDHKWYIIENYRFLSENFLLEEINVVQMTKKLQTWYYKMTRPKEKWFLQITQYTEEKTHEQNM
jgi:hypothetical protein